MRILLVSFTLFTAHAQSGILKVKGEIINVDENQQSLVTLYRVNANNENDLTVLGQYMVKGSSWFKTHMYMDQRYILEIASSNGLTKRYIFDMSVPNQAENDRHKMDLEFDMAYSGTEWPVITKGEIVYSNNVDDFTYNNWIEDNSIALNPKRR